MIKVIIIINNNSINWFILIISSIIIHLGRNPKKGGNPPNDKKLIMKQNLINGVLFLNKNNWLIWDIFNNLKIKIIEAFVKKYNKK